MPIYEYECLECQHKFEIIQPISASYPTCPECAAEVKRLISKPSTGQVHMDAREMYHEKTLPEAKEIARKIRAGDEKLAADVFGENNMFEPE